MKETLTECEELITIVGSAQYSHTMENPFTAGERIQMITEALDEEGISEKVYLIPVDDLHQHAIWVAYVKSLVPAFHVVFSNESLTSRLFREASYTVKGIKFLNRQAWSGTEIRRRIRCDEPWEECVPEAVARIIKEIDGVARIKELAQSDKM